LVSINPSSISDQVAKIYSDDIKRKIYLDDIKVYCLRSNYPDLIVSHATVMYI
jgi:hypothetical protein